MYVCVCVVRNRNSIAGRRDSSEILCLFLSSGSRFVSVNSITTGDEPRRCNEANTTENAMTRKRPGMMRIIMPSSVTSLQSTTDLSKRKVPQFSSKNEDKKKKERRCSSQSEKLLNFVSSLLLSSFCCKCFEFNHPL